MSLLSEVAMRMENEYHRERLSGRRLPSSTAEEAKESRWWMRRR